MEVTRLLLLVGPIRFVVVVVVVDAMLWMCEVVWTAKAWPAALTEQQVEAIQSSSLLLLQREIPDRINILAAQTAHNAGVPVILDAGGMDEPVGLGTPLKPPPNIKIFNDF